MAARGRRNPQTWPCTRCGGHGKLDVFSHVEKGICFKCEGRGTQDYPPPNRYKEIKRDNFWLKQPSKPIAILGRNAHIIKLPHGNGFWLHFNEVSPLYPDGDGDPVGFVFTVSPSGRVNVEEGTTGDVLRYFEIDVGAMDNFHPTDHRDYARAVAQWKALVRRIQAELQSKLKR